MKIVIFQGGLGNQIFQYAVAKYIQQNIDPDVYYICRQGNNHNGLEIFRHFDATLQEVPKVYKKMFSICEYFRKHHIMLPLSTTDSSSHPFSRLFVDGYWQNKKFFTDKFISFKELPLNSKNLEIYNQIVNSDSISIHIRRGDYLLPQYKDIYGNICTLEYYNQAISICKEHAPKCKFFVFSDDIEWVKNNLKLENAQYIDWNVKDDSIYDMYLMSKSKFNIIANSTFSFWGAFLNENNVWTIYPKKWFNSKFEAPDIFPGNWIGI